MMTDELSKLFRDAMDWGRSYGQRLNNSYELLDEVAEQFADKVRAIEAEVRKEQAGKIAELERQIGLLAGGISEAAIAAGICRPDADITGPLALMLCQDLLTNTKLLEQQLAEARKDSERYRVLRDGNSWPAVFSNHDAPEPLRGEDLDAAIKAKEQP